MEPVWNSRGTSSEQHDRLNFGQPCALGSYHLPGSTGLGTKNMGPASVTLHRGVAQREGDPCTKSHSAGVSSLSDPGLGSPHLPV